MLNEAKKEQVHSGSYLGDILLELFKKKFPEAQVSTRPSRLLKAAERIAAPLSNQRIDASSLSNYLEKKWIPRVRNKQGNSVALCGMQHDSLIS